MSMDEKLIIYLFFLVDKWWN